GISMDDQPDLHASWRDPRTGEQNSLVRITRRFALAAWLVARHRVRRTIIFLKNIAWGFNFVINVNSASRTVANSGPGMPAPATGDGQGGVSPRLDGQIYNAALAGATHSFAVRGATPSAVAKTVATPPEASPSKPTGTLPLPGSRRAPVSGATGASGGSALPPAVQAPVTRSLGVDTSNVRVHSDAPANNA